MQQLELETIQQGMPGLTPVIGKYLYENCLVCLNRANHTDGIPLRLLGLQEGTCNLRWQGQLTDQLQRSYQDDLETTEQGAVCLSILLTKYLTDYTIVERSWRGTGIDYWLGYSDDPLFQRAARLEISGIKIETSANTVFSRYGQKANQVSQSDQTELPAYISVVEFGTPKCLFNKK